MNRLHQFVTSIEHSDNWCNDLVWVCTYRFEMLVPQMAAFVYGLPPLTLTSSILFSPLNQDVVSVGVLVGPIVI